MEDRMRGAWHLADANHANAAEQNRNSKPDKREKFARSMARAEFRHFYWNDDLEEEKQKSLEKARERIEEARRELVASARKRKKAGA